MQIPGLHRIARTLTLTTLVMTACDSVDEPGADSWETVADSDSTGAEIADEEALTSGSDAGVPGSSRPGLDQFGDAVAPSEGLPDVCRPTAFKIGDHTAGGHHGGTAGGGGTTSPPRPCPK